MFLKENLENNTNDSSAAENNENGNKPEDCDSVVVKTDGMAIRCVAIIGQVEGHSILPDTQKTTKYEHLLPLLVDVEEDDRVEGILFLLNTVGGDVEAGLAIAELIASMKKPTVSLVLGGGHSIGVPLAVSAKRSFIVPSATMTVHPVRISGTLIGAPQTYRYFSRMQNRITDFVVAHSKVTAEQFNGMLMRTEEMATDVGSILEGREAVDAGLIDQVGGLSEAIAALKEQVASCKREAE
ncbi:MAG: ATP-dependent Clp protease proteolytic subunit [Clostridia bacterium]|nr:ATP-dependent Clp protease proteolytic subunit [Clostridia bacterium]